MVTQLHFKSGNYICGNCMMKWIPKSYQCHFCGCEFSNYELVMLEIEDEINKDEIKSQFHFSNNLKNDKN